MDIDKDGNIYISVLSLHPQNTYIFKVDQNETIHQIGHDVVGFITSIHGDIHFVDFKVVTTGKLNGKKNRFYVSHENYLYNILDDSMKKINELPFEYTPVNFTYDETSIYTFSDIFNSLDRFDYNGKYIETLYQFEEDTKIRYLAFDETLKQVYATSPDNSKIYCIKKTD